MHQVCDISIVKYSVHFVVFQLFSKEAFGTINDSQFNGSGGDYHNHDGGFFSVFHSYLEKKNMSLYCICSGIL